MNEIARHGVDNVALLTPFRKKSETGVQSMNAALHDIANPPLTGKGGTGNRAEDLSRG